MSLLSHLYVGNSLKKSRNRWNYALIIQGQLFATLWTVACQAPLSIEFPRQEYWSGLPVSPSRGSSWPRDWTGISCTSWIAGRFFTHWATREALSSIHKLNNFWIVHTFALHISVPSYNCNQNCSPFVFSFEEWNTRKQNYSMHSENVRYSIK